MTSVANGSILLADLEELLQHPEWNHQMCKIVVAQPYGLYLTDITYPANRKINILSYVFFHS